MGSTKALGRSCWHVGGISRKPCGDDRDVGIAVHSVWCLPLCCTAMTFIGVTLAHCLRSMCLSFLLKKMGMEEEFTLAHSLRV